MDVEFSVHAAVALALRAEDQAEHLEDPGEKSDEQRRLAEPGQLVLPPGAAVPLGVPTGRLFVSTPARHQAPLPLLQGPQIWQPAYATN